MKRLKRGMTILLSSVLVCGIAHGQDPYPQTITCHETLQLCDKALRDQIKVTDLQAAIVEDMGKRYLIVAEQNQQLKEDANQWFRNPFLIGGVSFGLGALLMGVIKK